MNWGKSSVTNRESNARKKVLARGAAREQLWVSTGAFLLQIHCDASALGSGRCLVDLFVVVSRGRCSHACAPQTHTPRQWTSAPPNVATRRSPRAALTRHRCYRTICLPKC